MPRSRMSNNAPVPPIAATSSNESTASRSTRASRARRARPTEPDVDSWIGSRDGRVAHERAVEDLASGRVQHLDHAQFLAAFDVAWLPATIEWTVTDEFTRRYERLRGRSHRAVGSALTAFIEDLARATPGEAPTGRAGLQLRQMPRDSAVPKAWALFWSSVGRATYQVEWRRTDAGTIAHVTWLAIGPHGAPDGKRWRGNA